MISGPTLSEQLAGRRSTVLSIVDTGLPGVRKCINRSWCGIDRPTYATLTVPVGHREGQQGVARGDSHRALGIAGPWPAPRPGRHSYLCAAHRRLSTQRAHLLRRHQKTLQDVHASGEQSGLLKELRVLDPLSNPLRNAGPRARAARQDASIPIEPEGASA